ncbi:MAG: Suppressor of fused protein [Pseudonocardiales bacterium]|nr:Suppressor of fused protein [Pseudonocardiales bacterium]
MSAPEPMISIEKTLSDHFGQRPTRASVSFVGVEPIEVLRFEPIPGERAYVSLGMSRHPMTAASQVLVGADGPRAELLVHVHDDPGHSEVLWRQLAVLAAAPAVEGVVYTPGMTVDLGRPLAPESRCTGGLVVESPLAAIDTTAGPVSVLQVLPATSTELAWCRVHGAAALRERWASTQADLLDLGRRAVDLN